MKTLSEKIQFQCPECRATLRVPTDCAGRCGQCHTCKAVVRVPGSRVRTPRTSSTPRSSHTRERGKQRERGQKRERGEAHRRPCPQCGESVLLTAPRCRHCRSWIDPEESKESRQLLVRNTSAILLLLAVCLRVAHVLAIG